MAGPREAQLVEQIEQARVQQQQQAIIQAAQAQASQKLSDLGFKSASDSALRKAKLGDAKEDAERKARQQDSEGGGGLDIQKATSALNAVDPLRGGQGSKPPVFSTTADARGGAGAQRALGQLQGSQGSQGGFNVPETITELQTKSGVESFQTPNAILRAPTSEASFTTRQNALTPGQALTSRVGEERNRLTQEQDRLAQEKQRLDQLQEQVEFDGASGSGLLSQQSRGGLPEGTFDKWLEGIAQTKGKEYAGKVGRQALFQNLQDEAEFDKDATLREISGRTDASKNLEGIESRIAAGDLIGANRLAVLATKNSDMHLEVSPDGKVIWSTGSGSNAQAKIRNNRDLFGARETVRVLEQLRDAVEQRRELAGVPGQAGRAAIRMEGIFSDLNRAGQLTELRDVLRLQFDRDVKAGLVPEFIREAVRDARQISELRSLTTLVTYTMVRDLKEGRPSDRDFRILNSDLAGFTTADEVLGDLDAKLNLFKPRVRFYEDQVEILKSQTNPLDFQSIVEDQRAAKDKSKRNEFELTESGELKRVK